MAIIHLKVKPLTVNQAWKGRRYTSDDYKAYIAECLYKLPKITVEAKRYEIIFRFYLIHHATTDYDNLIKPIQDILVKKGILPDDRFIYKASQEKIPSNTDYIEIELLPLMV